MAGKSLERVLDMKDEGKYRLTERLMMTGKDYLELSSPNFPYLPSFSYV